MNNLPKIYFRHFNISLTQIPYIFASLSSLQFFAQLKRTNSNPEIVSFYANSNHDVLHLPSKNSSPNSLKHISTLNEQIAISRRQSTSTSNERRRSVLHIQKKKNISHTGKLFLREATVRDIVRVVDRLIRNNRRDSVGIVETAKKQPCR